MALVGALRTFGAPAPLTSALGHHLSSMNHKITQAPRVLLSLLALIVVGTAFFSIQQPFLVGSFLIKLGVLCYLAWGTLAGRQSARWLLSLFLVFSIYVNMMQLAEDPNWTSLESVIQFGWLALLSVTLGNLWVARSTREHLKQMQSVGVTE